MPAQNAAGEETESEDCATDNRATTRVAPPEDDSPANGLAQASSLGQIVGAFKSITTHQYIQGVRQKGWAPFHKRFWQRNYYERIIRNEREL